MERTDELKRIKDEIIALSGSALADERVANKVFPVIGEGDHHAKLIFIGEAPGENEAKTGRPFVGRAGKFLNELLESIDVPRESVYITNIVKDRPPKNRDPLPEEIDMYAPFLDRQIAIIKPKVIATLGRFSMQYIMNRYGLEWEIDPISSLHGKIFDTEIAGEKVKIVPLYHPAVALYDGSKRGELLEDFKVLKSLI
jgi:uracil-DNA glycosylase family 4